MRSDLLICWFQLISLQVSHTWVYLLAVRAQPKLLSLTRNQNLQTFGICGAMLVFDDASLRRPDNCDIRGGIRVESVNKLRLQILKINPQVPPPPPTPPIQACAPGVMC